MDTYVLNEHDHFQLAGSGGGHFHGPGLYYFDEDSDSWKIRTAGANERQNALRNALIEKYGEDWIDGKSGESLDDQNTRYARICLYNAAIRWIDGDLSAVKYYEAQAARFKPGVSL